MFKQTNDNGTYEGRDNDGTDDNQGDNGTDESHDYCEANDSREKDCSDGGHKDSFKEKDGADLFFVTHETQVSEGGEADLHKHRVSCKKNPGHAKFVPVNDFDVTHLPDGYHDNDLFELIKATADLTVRLGVKMTSTERPEFWPNTTKPYAFYSMRGSVVMRVGTGMVCDVSKLTETDIKKYNKGSCPCHKCTNSATPSKVWGEIEMYTATHVVFDDPEAKHTTCRLFFDSQDCPVVTLKGWTVSKINIEEDWCILQCVTCDVDLLDKLENMWTHWRDLWNKVNNKYKSSRDEVKMIFIVSHPHGCSKQISLGHWINRSVMDRDDEGNFVTRYTYTACTCPGSSGAHIHPLGYDDWVYAHHVHSGVNSKGKNVSAIGRDL